MDTRLRNVCLQILDRAGITADERSLKITSEEELMLDSKLLTVLLDGQEIGQTGRFASMGVDSKLNAISFVLLLNASKILAFN